MGAGGEGAYVPPKTPMGTGMGGHAPGSSGAPDECLTGQDKEKVGKDDD